MSEARRLRITGTVQGVGFRPFVARLADLHGLAGWVRNGPHGAEIHVEGPRTSIDAFQGALATDAPSIARVDAVAAHEAAEERCQGFRIRASDQCQRPTARISPDLATCAECLEEMSDRAARRHGYPYINCTQCGPRFSIIRRLPYDRARTTMEPWTMCASCAREYDDVLDRRFHAEPIACPECGPRYWLTERDREPVAGPAAIAEAAGRLRSGAIVAIKGLGGYHLSCDAANERSVRELRERKYRKSRPFAVMACDLETARGLVELGPADEHLLTSPLRPIVLAPARLSLSGVAPGHHELGVMLPYAPIHHLLFGAGSPRVLVMTSGNASSEPIAFDDGDAHERLAGIADAFLTGDRDIARRVDDSVVRGGSQGPVVLRRGRGYAPGVVARLPAPRPILAVGADLKNTIALVIDGQVIASQHIGDLDHVGAYESFRATIADLAGMYEVVLDEALIVHDLHPHYRSSAFAQELPAAGRIAVQHHRAHIASVLAERGALETTVIGVAFDGMGYGDDATIWGGEFFVGSVAAGFRREGSLRPFALPGGDAAARHPVQAAAGFLSELDGLPDLLAPPFLLPKRYIHARMLAQSGVRTFTTTSAGRLFDTAAALLGFTGRIDYEGQAAIWLEQLARRSRACGSLPFLADDAQLDYRPTLRALIDRRLAGHDVTLLARAFHETIAAGILSLSERLCESGGTDTIVLSGGTFQNALLLERVRARAPASLRIWTNQTVPPNDGGISVGQAALASMRT